MGFTESHLLDPVDSLPTARGIKKRVRMGSSEGAATVISRSLADPLFLCPSDSPELHSPVYENGASEDLVVQVKLTHVLNVVSWSS